MGGTVSSDVVRRGGLGPLLELHGRIQYALLMGSLVILALTGLPQKFDSLGLSLWVMNAAGGIEPLRMVHRAVGGVLIFAAVYRLALAIITVLVLRSMGPLAMAPDFQDIRDTWQMVRYFLGLRHDRVAFERPSYLEKIDYLVIAWAVAVMGVSGVLFLFPVRVSRVLSGDAVLAALEVHSDSAVLVVAWVVVVHLVYARLAPTLFPSRTRLLKGKAARARPAARSVPEPAPATTATAIARDGDGDLPTVVPEMEVELRPHEKAGLSDKSEVSR
jgi:cytochrome b subunit of formate dehydrogenase